VEVLPWDEKKGQQRRVFRYPADQRFLIHEEAKYGYMLVTAYYVEHDHTHERYMRKFERYST